MSYRHSLQKIRTDKDLDALLVHFDIAELWSDLTIPSLQYKLDDPAQKMLELLLIQKPLMSAMDPAPAFEILSAALVPRSQSLQEQRTMDFLSWDAYGERGTAAHALNYGTSSFSDFLSSSFWALFGFVLTVVIVVVVVCLICVFGWGFWTDDYEKAQMGKQRRSGGRSGGSFGKSDVEAGKGRGRFLSAEELGMRGTGRVVGMGKSD